MTQQYKLVKERTIPSSNPPKTYSSGNQQDSSNAWVPLGEVLEVVSDVGIHTCGYWVTPFQPLENDRGMKAGLVWLVFHDRVTRLHESYFYCTLKNSTLLAVRRVGVDGGHRHSFECCQKLDPNFPSLFCPILSPNLGLLALLEMSWFLLKPGLPAGLAQGESYDEEVTGSGLWKSEATTTTLDIEFWTKSLRTKTTPKTNLYLKQHSCWW